MGTVVMMVMRTALACCRTLCQVETVDANVTDLATGQKTQRRCPRQEVQRERGRQRERHEKGALSDGWGELVYKPS